MATETKKQTEEKKNLLEFDLKNGKKLTLDLSKNDGNLLMKCREASNGSATVIFLISEIGLFDGEKIPAPEILNWSAFDIIELETIWGKLAEKKS